MHLIQRNIRLDGQFVYSLDIMMEGVTTAFEEEHLLSKRLMNASEEPLGTSLSLFLWKILNWLKVVPTFVDLFYSEHSVHEFKSILFCEYSRHQAIFLVHDFDRQQTVVKWTTSYLWPPCLVLSK